MPIFDAGHCHYCNRELFGGRSDKRFCSDICRNAFNRERRKDEARLFGEDVREQILKTIKKNYALLLKFNPMGESFRIVDRQAIYLKGFNFRYFTSCKKVDNDLIYFCFDYGWRDLEYGLIELFVDEDQLMK
ncbi:hypothetical protein KXD93_22600 [Mucilaginibacter sp. BJC16-A38]|uniref:hypothetical protein n=1 Tax=Mucilaginibacter phenanthrenivorans TaxID=1234842 RepID=UPI0021579218|nr:hypothetical protein [Mucilaginibacter phenanthrenivorans]MCR8560462.1 hypothetical protein [Mucilaginibacter phenanthrenivorans]